LKKKISCFLPLILVLAFVFSPLFSAQKPAKKLALKGFSEFVAKTMADWKVPGIAVSVVKDGQVIYAEGFGFRDVEKQLKVTPQTLFAIGSCSKAFTAADVAILVDEGKLAWDKPVRSYLPAFKLFDPIASEHMTPLDLLCHRSGLPRHDLMWYGSPLSRKELFDRLQHLEPNKEFRAVWQYQNLMFMTAGYLVGEAAGTSWEEFTRKRIFEPLGMKASNFSVADSEKSPDFSYPYGEKKDKVERIPFRNIDAIGPAGSINSNVVEMANWVLLNLGKGKWGDKQLISEAAMTQVHSPQMVIQGPLRYDEMFHSSYGLGWLITAYKGHLLLTHGGGIDGFITLVSFLPRDKVGVVVLSNLSGNPVPSLVSYNLFDQLLGVEQTDWNKRFLEERDKAREESEKAKKEAAKDRKPDTKPSHPLEEYAGDYEHPGYGVFSVIKEGEGLKVRFNSLEFPLGHYHYDIFELNIEDFGLTPRLTFTTDLKGSIGGFSISLEPTVKDVVFTRMPEKKMTDKSFLEKFVGLYEIKGAEIRFYLREEKTLILSVPGQPEYELVPYKGTEFNLKGMAGFSVEFKLDEKGAVTEAVFKQPNGVFPAKRK
jgi:CubicO group peptidase (beta-lactamase class C family)